MVLDGARIFHVNVNCGDLDRSRRFYEAIGFDATVHTAPAAPQPGAAFGLDLAQWDAWILCGAQGFDGGAIDLLEWKQPPPTAAPPAVLFECGYQRLGVLVADLDATVARIAPHTSAEASRLEHTNDDGSATRLALARDPDGTVVELVELEGTSGAQLSFVSVACRDLDASLAFYASLGFREVARFTSEHDDGRPLGIEGALAMDEVVLRAPGGGRVLLMLVGFRVPEVLALPARPANARGIWRTALIVADLDSTVGTLRELDVELMSEPAALAMGDGLPELRFVCFRGLDGEVLELIEQPASA